MLGNTNFAPAIAVFPLGRGRHIARFKSGAKEAAGANTIKRVQCGSKTSMRRLENRSLRGCAL